MKLVFGSDHAGFALRRSLCDHAIAEGHSCSEVGAMSPEPMDYPDAADELAQKLLREGFDFGILVCGSGIGVCIRANRYDGIRAAQCWNEETARMARAHNYANVLCLGERLIEQALAIRIFEAFIAAPEDHAERHERRVEKLDGPTG